MSTVTEEIAGQIDERVEKIQAEIRKLEEARAALTGSIAERKTQRIRRQGYSGGSTKRVAARRNVRGQIKYDGEKLLEQMKSERENRREKLKVIRDHVESGPLPDRPAKRRARRGSRPRQVLDLISAKPGISTMGLVAVIADGDASHVYRVVKKLSDAGKITGSHKGWKLKG